MQALNSKSVRVTPFCKISVAAPCRIYRSSAGKFAAQAPTQQSRVITKAAALNLEDLDDDLYAEAVEVQQFSGIPAGDVKLRVRMKSYVPALLAEACDQVSAIAEASGAVFKGPVMLPTKRRVYCVLRSPHVNKDAREHFEIKTHNRLIDVKNLSAETVAALMEWVPPAGVEAKCSIV